MTKIKVYQCFKTCECDMDGEGVCGLRNGQIIKESEITEESKRDVMWGSATCSKCEQVAYIKDGSC